MIGQTLGHYLVLEEIGKGGMGVVYRAHDNRLDRDVAVKVLSSGTTRDSASRDHLRKEALALSRLSHPNIAHVYDFDTQGGIEFLVMEYIKGIALSRKLADGPLPEEIAISLGTQIASALENAAEVGIVHRDLKPGNAMITPKGSIKVLDFGLAKLFRPADESLTQSLTNISECAGTLPYMAPEQLKGESTDFRTDIYALGAMLYLSYA
jgi:serine/threonine protein kinase